MDRGVFYPQVGSGEAWHGLTSIQEFTTDSDEKPRYIDGVKVQNLRQLGYFSGVIESVSYPPSFYEDILTQRKPKSFGLSYRVQGDTGYKIHLVYNVLLAPSPFAYRQNEVERHSWAFTSVPVAVPGAARSAHLVIDTSIAYSWTVAVLEGVLYGSETEDARLPTPEEVLSIFEVNSILQIIDHGDGTWTAIGPDSVVQLLDSTTFEINWPSAVFIDADSYTVSSL